MQEEKNPQEDFARFLAKIKAERPSTNSNPAILGLPEESNNNVIQGL